MLGHHSNAEAERDAEMYKHILIATDGSELAQKGLGHGLALAKSLGSKVTIITVTEPFPVYGMAGEFGWVGSPADVESYKNGSKEFARKVLSAAKAAADKAGVKAEVLHIDDSTPADAIVAIAKERGNDLIVMASHGRRGIGRLLLGSQTSEVLTHSTVPVLVVR